MLKYDVVEAAELIPYSLVMFCRLIAPRYSLGVFE